MTHWRAGSRACSRLNFCEVFFSFFFAKKIEPATWRWASYEALSQLRGIEPATWHWASYAALSQQGSFELWASKEAVSQQGSFELHHIYIYTPMQSQPCNILDLGKSNFFEGDTYLWAGAGMWNLTLYIPQPGLENTLKFPWDIQDYKGELRLGSCHVEISRVSRWLTPRDVGGWVHPMSIKVK